MALLPANEDEIILLWACQPLSQQYLLQRGNIFIYSMGWSQKLFIIQMGICYSRQFTNQLSGRSFIFLCGQLFSSSGRQTIGHLMCKANGKQFTNADQQLLILCHHIFSVNRSNGMTWSLQPLICVRNT